jgi:hypothetical protein
MTPVAKKGTPTYLCENTYKKCSWGRTVPHDGSEASSRGLIQGDFEFKLEVDTISKSEAWL